MSEIRLTLHEEPIIILRSTSFAHTPGLFRMWLAQWRIDRDIVDKMICAYSNDIRTIGRIWDAVMGKIPHVIDEKAGTVSIYNNLLSVGK